MNSLNDNMLTADIYIANEYVAIFIGLFVNFPLIFLILKSKNGELNKYNRILCQSAIIDISLNIIGFIVRLVNNFFYKIQWWWKNLILSKISVSIFFVRHYLQELSIILGENEKKNHFPEILNKSISWNIRKDMLI